MGLLVQHHGSQKAAASALGVSHGSLCTLSKGLVGARLHTTLDAIAGALGVPRASLLADGSRLGCISRQAQAALGEAARRAYERAGCGDADAWPWAVFGSYVALQEEGEAPWRAAGGYVQCLIDRARPGVLWPALPRAAMAGWIEAARAVMDASFVGVGS